MLKPTEDNGIKTKPIEDNGLTRSCEEVLNGMCDLDDISRPIDMLAYGTPLCDDTNGDTNGHINTEAKKVEFLTEQALGIWSINGTPNIYVDGTNKIIDSRTQQEVSSGKVTLLIPKAVSNQTSTYRYVRIYALVVNTTNSPKQVKVIAPNGKSVDVEVQPNKMQSVKVCSDTVRYNGYATIKAEVVNGDPMSETLYVAPINLIVRNSKTESLKATRAKAHNINRATVGAAYLKNNNALIMELPVEGNIASGDNTDITIGINNTTNKDIKFSITNNNSKHSFVGTVGAGRFFRLTEILPTKGERGTYNELYTLTVGNNKAQGSLKINIHIPT